MVEPASTDCMVSVLGSFVLSVENVPQRGLPHGSERLLALLALRDRALHRTVVAGILWPEVSEEHARASLRSALGRLSESTRPIVRVTSQELQLAEDVRVDLREARALVHRILNSGESDFEDLNDSAISTLSVDLLPEWSDEWATEDAEEWRQLRLHALDALADRLTAAGHYGDATSAALAAVKAEPLRETAHAALIRVYLAEGNRAEALDAFEDYRALLTSELGIEPSIALSSLLKNL